MRTHDQLYLHEDRYVDTKESFKFCWHLAKKYGFATADSIYDFGCATGEFCYFLHQQAKTAHVVGIDVLPELIQRATERVAGVSFQVGSVLDPHIVLENTAQLSFLSGVHSIFDNPLPAFSNLIRWTKPNGLIIIFGLFNRYPADVFLKVRRTTDESDHRESGWNMISQDTVKKFLHEEKKVKKYHFHEFFINVDIPQHAEDCLRSWTFKNINDVRMIINGTGLLHDFHALVIELHKSQ